ncbi:MAG TPA: hypothetical protein VMG63_04675 [Terriglobia bacterium]|jgi:hypothetical protein|nr:hypothetical protein [Terriglobia bacterium]
MRPLNFRVSMGDQGARFAQSEVEPPEHPLALANPQGEAEVLLDPSTQRLRPCKAIQAGTRYSFRYSYSASL